MMRLVLVFAVLSFAFAASPLVASAATPQAGFGNAPSFQSSALLTPYSSALSFGGSDSFTVEMWVKPDASISPNGNYTLFRAQAWEYGAMGWWMFMGGDRKIVLGLDWSGHPWSAWDWNRSQQAIPAGKWTHVAVVKNGTSIAYFFNGQPAGTDVVDPIQQTATSQPTVKGQIGGDDVEGNNFLGQLDEVRVWNTALSQTTLDGWRYRGADVSHPDWTSLVAYYPMDESSGSSMGDVSGVVGAATMYGPATLGSPSTVSLLQTIDEDTSVSERLAHFDADGGALSAAVSAPASHGTVTITNAATASYTYTPNSDFNGVDTFGYTISDGSATSASQTVTITVTPVDDPEPAPQSVSTPASGPLALLLLGVSGIALIARHRTVR